MFKVISKTKKTNEKDKAGTSAINENFVLTFRYFWGPEEIVDEAVFRAECAKIQVNVDKYLKHQSNSGSLEVSKPILNAKLLIDDFVDLFDPN